MANQNFNPFAPAPKQQQAQPMITKDQAHVAERNQVVNIGKVETQTGEYYNQQPFKKFEQPLMTNDFLNDQIQQKNQAYQIDLISDSDL